MPRDHLLRSTEIPQADSLSSVRRVLAAAATGAVTKERAAEQTGLSLRQVEYALKAAQVLGWLGDDGVSVTPSGQALLVAPPGTVEERSCFRHAILGCEVVIDALVAQRPVAQVRVVGRHPRARAQLP